MRVRLAYPELPGCTAEAAVVEDALRELERRRIELIVGLVEKGKQPPMPRKPLTASDPLWTAQDLGLSDRVAVFIEKKKKIVVNANTIKEQLILFLRCDIENPAFDSQTKDFMNTPMAKFGSKCDVSDKFIEKVAKMVVMDAACAITEVKENKAAKKTDGTKSKKVTGIPKLDDANWAGTEKSKDRMIIFCEGDSAKTGVISGLSSEDRNTIGVYPLKGKVMNVRGEAVKKVSENKEIAEIKKILGLETGKEYKNIEDVHKHLRYSKVVFMTDQDLDGSHIKGLGITLIQSEWPTLFNSRIYWFHEYSYFKSQKGFNRIELL